MVASSSVVPVATLELWRPVFEGLQSVAAVQLVPKVGSRAAALVRDLPADSYRKQEIEKNTAQARVRGG